MSGYTRGGVQLMNIRAAPSPAPAVAAGGTISGPGVYSVPLKAPQAVPQARPVPPLQVTTDDYERWYTEPSPSNRMLLSLRSGIDSEVAWSLNRLCRLCVNEQFLLANIPGLTDALFEWPEWFLDEYSKPGSSSEATRMKIEPAVEDALFSVSPDVKRRRRHALESLFIFRNASISEANAADLAMMPRTRKLVFNALDRLSPLINTSDECAEFVLHCIEILHSIVRNIILPPPSRTQEPRTNPIPALERLASGSSNRSIIIASLIALTHLVCIPKNALHSSTSSPALTTAIRNLALYNDSALFEASVGFLYAHLSYPPMTKAFLVHPDMPATLRLLVGYIVAEQNEEDAVIDVSAPRHLAPIVKTRSVNYELTGSELEKIGTLPEPERCYKWMKTMYMAAPDKEVTQVEFWTNYKELFTPFQDRSTLLVASDVIKNVGTVYAQAQAMVLPGPPQRFVIRGISRSQKEVAEGYYKCQWDRSTCESTNFTNPDELYEHLKTAHLEPLASAELPVDFSCSWSTCQHSAESIERLRPHVWTHIPLRSALPADLTHIPKVAFASKTEQHLTPTPTARATPPAPQTRVTYPAPGRDPPSNALTALLVIRTLFRASFASVEAAPRADADHFGFPGVVEENDEMELAVSDTDSEAEKEGERRGRKAFIGVRHLMESIRLRDTALMAWIMEMVDAGINGVQ